MAQVCHAVAWFGLTYRQGALELGVESRLGSVRVKVQQVVVCKTR